MRKPLLPTLLMLCASTPDANAVGSKSQQNCASDYFAYCSKFEVGSKELRKCMRDNGPKLSKACINALIADGEVSKDEVAQRKEEIASAKAKSKPEHKKVAKLTDEPKRPKQNVVRQPEIQQSLKQKPKLVSKTKTLDQWTWEALYLTAVDTEKVPPSQTWDEYMRSRFNGDTNYEGVGARFTEGK